MIVIDQGFVIAPGEAIQPGDLVVIDQGTGKLRRFVMGVDTNGFRVPRGSYTDLETGELCMPYRPAPLSPLRHENENEKVTPTVEMKPTKITQRRGPTVKFTGAVIAKGEFPTKQGFDMRMEVYQTEGGAYVAVTSSDVETRAVVVEPADPMDMQCAVMDAFDWHDRARTMLRDQLKWKFVREVK